MGSFEDFSGVVKTFNPVLEDLFTALGGGSPTPGVGSAADK
ncbi:MULTISPECIES: hypothetical protein [Rhodococcus]|nr:MULTISPECIES: hypothetical protein [Rhodococcus]MCT6735877.1 hypothetical protein [Rhodococcus qingshengii]MEA1793749.1 hypothetical protein [Rhodococcus qingshengii]